MTVVHKIADPRRFTVGQWVLCEAYARVQHVFQGGRKLVICDFKPPVMGQVVGIATRYSGHFDYHEYDFAHKGTHRFWKVSQGLINKPVIVPDDRIVAAEGTGLLMLPFYHCPNSCSERDREALREEMKTWPRDDKGRWLPATPLVTKYNQVGKP